MLGWASGALGESYGERPMRHPKRLRKRLVRRNIDTVLFRLGLAFYGSRRNTSSAARQVLGCDPSAGTTLVLSRILGELAGRKSIVGRTRSLTRSRWAADLKTVKRKNKL